MWVGLILRRLWVISPEGDMKACFVFSKWLLHVGIRIILSGD